MALYLRLVISVMWLVGAVLVWHFGRRVPRLTYPMTWCSVGFFMFAIRSFVAATAEEENGFVHPDHWVVDLSILITIPAVAAVVGGLVYACANADRLQRTIPAIKIREDD